MSGLAARVRALADEWQETYDRWAGVSDAPRVGIFRAHANRLRALLAEDETPASSDDAEALARVLWAATVRGAIAGEPLLHEEADNLAAAVLASDWLAEHDERIRIEAYERGLADPGSAWMQGNGERERAAEARALREAADAVVDECSRSAESCFCGSAEWLRERADRIEAQR